VVLKQQKQAGSQLFLSLFLALYLAHSPSFTFADQEPSASLCWLLPVSLSPFSLLLVVFFIARGWIFS